MVKPILVTPPPCNIHRADVYDRVRQWWDTTVLAGGAQLCCGPSGRTVDVVVAVTHGLAMRLILMQVAAAAGGGQGLRPFILDVAQMQFMDAICSVVRFGPSPASGWDAQPVGGGEAAWEGKGRRRLGRHRLLWRASRRPGRGSEGGKGGVHAPHEEHRTGSGAIARARG